MSLSAPSSHRMRQMPTHDTALTGKDSYMKKQRSLIAFMLIMILAASMLLVSCGQAGDEGGDSAEALTLLYEGYGNEVVNYITQQGEGPEIESRVYGWLYENTSDKDIRKVNVSVIAMDENGEVLKMEDGTDPEKTRIQLHGLKPGEKIWYETMEGEWEKVPASFEFKVINVEWGNVKGGPITITAADTVYRNDVSSVYELTIRNDGEDVFTWLNDWSEVDSDPGRQFRIAGADKDADGKVVHAELVTTIADEETYAPVDENINIAPGEEIKVLVTDNGNLEDPEFMLCWY